MFSTLAYGFWPAKVLRKAVLECTPQRLVGLYFSPEDMERYKDPALSKVEKEAIEDDARRRGPVPHSGAAFLVTIRPVQDSDKPNHCAGMAGVKHDSLCRDVVRYIAELPKDKLGRTDQSSLTKNPYEHLLLGFSNLGPFVGHSTYFMWGDLYLLANFDLHGNSYMEEGRCKTIELEYGHEK